MVHFLENRSQLAMFNSVLSSFMYVSHGVPQGYTLGPLLYILYVNDCFDKVQHNVSSVIMYADDTVLLSKGKTEEEAIIIHFTNQMLFEKYINWADVNFLNINIDVPDHIGIHKNDQNVSKASTYTYLGVDIDCTLTFEPFVMSIIRKVNYKLYLFSKIRYVLTFTAATLVYKQMVLPFFDYLDILIYSGPKEYIDKLQTLQFRGIKIIYQYHINGRKIKNCDEDFLHKELGI